MSDNNIDEDELYQIVSLTGIFEHAVRDALIKDEARVSKLVSMRTIQENEKFFSIENDNVKKIYQYSREEITRGDYLKYLMKDYFEVKFADISRVFTEDELYDMLPDDLRSNNKVSSTLNSIGAKKIAAICAYKPK